MANETTRHGEVLEVAALRAQLDSVNAERGHERQRGGSAPDDTTLSASQKLGFE